MGRFRQKLAGLLVVAFCLMMVTAGAEAQTNGFFPFPAKGKKLNILTINLMLVNSESLLDWPDRVEDLVSFIREEEESGRPIHIIMCQEGHGGIDFLHGTDNTITDLRDRLAAEGVVYDVESIVSFPNPDVPQGIESNYLVGVLSKYPILGVRPINTACSGATSGAEIRKAIACGFMVPGIGTVACYSVHLSPVCGGDAGQVDDLMDFIDGLLPFHRSSPVLHILGGDFNAESGSQLYKRMTVTEGFIDTFDAVHDISLDPGDTFYVPGNPFCYNADGSPKIPGLDERRIDYIFVKGGQGTYIDVGSSEVVLDGHRGEFMSDHCGVLSRIGIRPPIGAKPMKYRFTPYPFPIN